MPPYSLWNVTRFSSRVSLPQPNGMAPIVYIKWAGSEFKWETFTRMHVHTCKHTCLFYRHSFRRVNLLCLCCIHAPAVFSFKSYLDTWIHWQETLAEPVNFRQWLQKHCTELIFYIGTYKWITYNNMGQDTCPMLTHTVNRNNVMWLACPVNCNL